MSSTLSQPSTASTQPISNRHFGEQRIVLEGISWETYEGILAEHQNAGVRLAYDQGRLEIMSPSRMHEKYKRLLGRAAEVVAEELDKPLESGSATTFRRREIRRGLEPDECYWVKNARAVLGKREIDFAKDPPPDLAIEIDMTSSSLDKLAVYASFGVPEVWRYDGHSLRIATLRSDGTYEPSEKSPSFPAVPPADLERFLQRWAETDETAWAKEFRGWVRNRVKGDAT